MHIKETKGATDSAKGVEGDGDIIIGHTSRCLGFLSNWSIDED
jgi:hypothetical protein